MSATSTPFLSEINIIAFNFAPRGYALCNGQFLPINQNQALFSLLGTTYGGNGQTNFALPDFRGKIPMHWGNGFTLGNVTGSSSKTLTVANIQGHEHAVTAQLKLPSGGTANATSPAGAYPAAAVTGSPRYSNQADEQMAVAQANELVADQATSPLVTLPSQTGGTAVNNMMPYLGLYFIIALQGVFPSRT